MRLAILSFLLLFSATTLSAATSKVIISGAFYTPEHAQQRVDKLRMYLRYEPETYALQKAGYFTYEVRRSGPYYLCVLHDFRDFGEVLTVINSIRKIYPDVYIKNNMSFTQPYNPAAVVPQAVMEPAAGKPLPDEQVVVVPTVEQSSVVPPAQPAAEVETFTEEKTIRPVPGESALSLPMLLIIASLLGAAALLLFTFMQRRKQEQRPLLIIPDDVAFDTEETAQRAASADAKAARPETEEASETDAPAEIAEAGESVEPETPREEEAEAEKAEAEKVETAEVEAGGAEEDAAAEKEATVLPKPESPAPTAS